jgi:hypothetical protein
VADEDSGEVIDAGDGAGWIPSKVVGMTHWWPRSRRGRRCRHLCQLDPDEGIRNGLWAPEIRMVGMAH